MKFELKQQKNGFLFRSLDEEEGVVTRQTCEDEIDAWRLFLQEINEHYGPSTSRYSKKRICVCIVPGDKSEPPYDYELPECHKKPIDEE